MAHAKPQKIYYQLTDEQFNKLLAARQRPKPTPMTFVMFGVVMVGGLLLPHLNTESPLSGFEHAAAIAALVQLAFP